METDVATPSRDHSRVPLSRERIVCAARDFIDRECLADLSMRKLGSELGVEAMSLYRYFPSKSELLDAVVELVSRTLDVPDHRTAWADGIRRFARSLRLIGRAHPGIFPLLASSASGHAAMRHATDEVASSMRRGGFGESAVERAREAVIGYVIGSTLWQLGDAASEAERVPDSDDGDFEFGLEVLLAGLDDRLRAAES